jgi:spore coat polysaccharide biosynthesis predicted glycosyltransferase SpsG
MDILIAVSGGTSIGFGHITRCLSVYQAFSENRSAFGGEEQRTIPFLAVQGDDTVKDIVVSTNYQLINWIHNPELLFELRKQYDVVIIDSYEPSVEVYTYIVQKARIGIYFDDYNRIEYPPGIVINGNVSSEEYTYPSKDGVTYLLGPKYIPLRKEFWDIPEKEINPEMKKILILFGGTKQSEFLHKIHKFLIEKYRFSVNSIDTSGKRYNATEILHCMQEADICISGGGQTLYELARIGVPTIGICLSENQRTNLEHLHQLGCIDYIGWYNDENLFHKLEISLKQLQSYTVRQKYSETGKALVDGNGARVIVQAILNYK